MISLMNFDYLMSMMTSKECQSPKFEHFSESLNDIDEDLNPRYLPVTRQEGFDLRAHIETAGHQVH